MPPMRSYNKLKRPRGKSGPWLSWSLRHENVSRNPVFAWRQQKQVSQIDTPLRRITLFQHLKILLKKRSRRAPKMFSFKCHLWHLMIGIDNLNVQFANVVACHVKNWGWAFINQVDNQFNGMIDTNGWRQRKLRAYSTLGDCRTRDGSRKLLCPNRSARLG
jgi:hypothetical protein